MAYSDVRLFYFEGHKVRAVFCGEDTGCVLDDVCDVLGLPEPGRITDSLYEDAYTQMTVTDPKHGDQEVTVVNALGLYDLIQQSDKPFAKKFKRFVFSKILSDTNGYSFAAEDLLTPDFVIQLLTKMREERDLRIKAERKCKKLEIQLDIASDWFTVKRWARVTGVDWRYVGDPTGKGRGWKALEALSAENDYEVKRSFDTHHGEVNAYHRDIYELL